MYDNIKISNPQEVKDQINRTARLVQLYQDEVSKIQAELMNTESVVLQTRESVNKKITNLQIASNRAKEEEASEDAQNALKEYQTQLAVCDKNLRLIDQHIEGLNALKNDYLSITRKCTNLVDNTRAISKKIENVIDAIIASR